MEKVFLFVTMAFEFYKYQGAGNDFIVIDNRNLSANHLDQKTLADICNRRFGIGADGVILLQNKKDYDFEMVYFNADGNLGSMCGNGGRCITAFAKKLGIINKECTFWAADGEHQAKVIQNDFIELKMANVKDIAIFDSYCFLDTGSPHHICFVDKADKIDVYQAGQEIRYSDKYQAQGVNVNFVEICSENHLKVFTYERGVEDETLACGTGVTAASLAYFLKHKNKKTGHHSVDIETKGAKLSVKFHFDNDEFSDIWLCGPANYVFEGKMNLDF